jgi:hypothetical protein
MTTLASDSHRPIHVTVRELGGEIWDELSSFPDEELHWETKNRVHGDQDSERANR